MGDATVLPLPLRAWAVKRTEVAGGVPRQQASVRRSRGPLPPTPSRKGRGGILPDPSTP